MPKPVDPITAMTPTVVSRLLDQAEASDSRAEREHKAAIEALGRQVTLWQRTTISLILVLLVLVAGISGVGVTGKIPGVGDITIKSLTEASPTPEVVPVKVEPFVGPVLPKQVAAPESTLPATSPQ